MKWTSTNGALCVLGLKLARSGGRARWVTVVAGAALTTALLLIAYSVPQALREPGVEVLTSQKIQDMQLVVLFAIPVLALLFTVLRLSSATRDRRLAGLRLLGLGPQETRIVAAVEGASTAFVGALIGACISVIVALGTAAWGWGSLWLKQPFDLNPLPIAAGVLLVSSIAVVVSLAPTRGLNIDPRMARSEAAPTRVSWWRAVPLLVGAGVLTWMVWGSHQSLIDDFGRLPMWWYPVLMGSWVLMGLSILLVIPLFSQGIAQVLGDQNRWLSGRLAGRRLAIEPASATRSVSGLALATYSSIIVLLFMIFVSQGSGRFMLEQSYLEQGPQPISLRTTGPTVETMATAAVLDGFAGVRHVNPQFDVKAQFLAGDVPCSDEPGAYPCLPVFIGSCQDFAQFRVVTGCKDNEIHFVSSAWVESDFEPRYPVPSEITLTGRDGSLELPVSSAEVIVDQNATHETFLKTSSAEELFLVPSNYPGVAEILGDPNAFAITADGGRDIQTELTEFAAVHGFTVSLPPSGTYERTMLGRAGLSSLIAAIVGIGLLTVGVGVIDRTLERRRAVGALVVIGVPVRTLRVSQVIQVLVPLAVSVALAIASGTLAARAFIRTEELEGVWNPGTVILTQDIAWVAIPLIVGCAVITLATLPGLGARLRPEMLRRD